MSSEPPDKPVVSYQSVGETPATKTVVATFIAGLLIGGAMVFGTMFVGIRIFDLGYGLVLEAITVILFLATVATILARTSRIDSKYLKRIWCISLLIGCGTALLIQGICTVVVINTI